MLPSIYSSLPVNHHHGVTREAVKILGQNRDFVQLWTDVEAKYACPLQIVPLTHEKAKKHFLFGATACYHFDSEKNIFSFAAIYFDKEKLHTSLHVVGCIAYNVLLLNQQEELQNLEPNLHSRDDFIESYQFILYKTTRLTDEFFQRGVSNGYFNAEEFEEVPWNRAFNTFKEYLEDAANNGHNKAIRSRWDSKQISAK